MARLLIIGCSQLKNRFAGRMPAIDRYEGPAFRVLRKFLRERPDDVPVIMILSAKYGLIASAKGIPNYDCRMSAERTERLRPALLKKVAQVLQSERWRAIGLCVGKEYLRALEG